jgi:triacylglycerol lipase
MRAGPGVLREATVGLDYVRLRRSPIFAGTGVARGDGATVVRVPGFLGDDRVLGVLHRWLRRNGYRTYGARTGRNAGCGEAMARVLERRVAEIAADRGGRVALAGYSRGAHVARVVAFRRPDLVRGLVTLGAPSLNPRCVHLLAAIPTTALMLLGSAGAPGLLRYSCFRGACCERFRADLEAPLPAAVPSIAVRSPRDAIVDHRFTPDAGARRVEVRCTHAGYIADRGAYAAVADALHSLRPRTTTTTRRRTR